MLEIKELHQQGSSLCNPDVWSQSNIFNSFGLFLVTHKATARDFILSFLACLIQTGSSSRQNKRQPRLFLSLSPDRLDRPLLRLPAGSQWRREAPLWVWRLHWLPNKGTVAGAVASSDKAWGFGRECDHLHAAIHAATKRKWKRPRAVYHICCLLPLQDGGTALTVASQYGHTKTVDTLLRNGANVHDQLNVRSQVVPHTQHPHLSIRLLFGLS